MRDWEEVGIRDWDKMGIRDWMEKGDFGISLGDRGRCRD